MTTKDDAKIARLKACIGYNAEPVRDTRGYWVIGYGRRLNDKPGGPKPEAYWSEQFADEELRHRVASAREEIPEARELASMGRGGDTEIAHLALGEIVLPSILQTPEVVNALLVAAAYARIPLDRFRIGMPQNSVNPYTGAMEFHPQYDFGDDDDDVSRPFGLDINIPATLGNSGSGKDRFGIDAATAQVQQGRDANLTAGTSTQTAPARPTPSNGASKEPLPVVPFDPENTMTVTGRSLDDIRLPNGSINDSKIDPNFDPGMPAIGRSPSTGWVPIKSRP